MIAGYHDALGFGWGWFTRQLDAVRRVLKKRSVRTMIDMAIATHGDAKVIEKRVQQAEE